MIKVERKASLESSLEGKVKYYDLDDAEFFTGFVVNKDESVEVMESFDYFSSQSAYRGELYDIFDLSLLKEYNAPTGNVEQIMFNCIKGKKNNKECVVCYPATVLDTEDTVVAIYTAHLITSDGKEIEVVW